MLGEFKQTTEMFHRILSGNTRCKLPVYCRALTAVVALFDEYRPPKKRRLDMTKIGMLGSDLKPRQLRFFNKFYETFLSFV